MDKRTVVFTGAAVAAAVIAVRAVGSHFGPPPEPPVLEKKAHQVAFGYVEGENRGENPTNPPILREDPYFWARDDTRQDKKIIGHLEKENKYTERMMKPLKSKTEALYKELLSHVQETDQSVPYKKGPFEYYTRTVEGSSYTIHCRRPLEGGDEEILLDENVLAKGLKHCDVGAVAPSPSHKLLAYTLDSTGYETYRVFVIDLATREVLDEQVLESSGNVCWGKDDKFLYYSTFDDAHRVNKVWNHEVTKPTASDRNLFTENDEVFSAYFYKSLSNRFLFCGAASSETSEMYMLDLNSEDNPEPRLIAARSKGILYDATDYKDGLYIITNKDGATNFKLMSAPLSDPRQEKWRDVFAYDEKVKLDHMSAFKDFAVLYGRQGGYTQMWLMTGTGDKKQFTFEEDSYTLSGAANAEFNTPVFRFRYSSLTTPTRTIEMDIATGERKIIKEQPVPEFDRSLYESRRLETKAADGTVVPISLVYKKGLLSDGTPRPCYLYGYGSYEISVDPSFRSTYLPILDRDVVVALAHIRGGGEMGRQHYEDAKYLKKRNTFTDFITCAEELIERKITSPEQLAIEGRSAGGLLIGSVINMRPDLFRVAVAGVPFVDVMNTMCDPSIPLTTGEWEEWGNPNEEKYFEYMLSYSPYDNVSEKNYPALLATSGVWDPRVAYWEPTKWIAKLREYNTSTWPILLKMDLSSGHFSASDRYKLYRERSFELSFLLNELGVL